MVLGLTVTKVVFELLAAQQAATTVVAINSNKGCF